VAAISTYLTVSFLFWYLGVLPDLAVMRDRAGALWARRVYGVFALGWNGSASTWARYRVGYGLMAGLAAPLVVSVHSIVSMDFAIAALPGWHSPIFPPYFVAGAIFSGFAMVVTLLVPARRLYRLESVVTARHLDNIGKLLLVTGLLVTYAYIVESFTAWLGGDPLERHIYLVSRPTGPYAALFWTVIACNCVVPQLMWARRLRRSPVALWTVSLFIQVGMWTERFMLIVSSLSRGHLPSSWGDYRPTFVDVGILAGTVFFFLFLFCCFLRAVPFIPISDLKQLVRERSQRAEAA
jgi:molybdopterin-containing oxidoreductase family membrane subunit